MRCQNYKHHLFLHAYIWFPIFFPGVQPFSPSPSRFSGAAAQAQLCNTREAHIAETFRNTAAFTGLILGSLWGSYKQFCIWPEKKKPQKANSTSKTTSLDSPQPLSACNIDTVQVFIASQRKWEDSPSQGVRPRQVSPTTEISPWRFTLRKGQKVESLQLCH